MIPPRSDRVPLACFIGQMLALSICATWLPPFLRAAYLAWVICGVAFLVQMQVAPGLPKTFGGNLLRILKAHAWPLFVVGR